MYISYVKTHLTSLLLCFHSLQYSLLIAYVISYPDGWYRNHNGSCTLSTRTCMNSWCWTSSLGSRAIFLSKRTHQPSCPSPNQTRSYKYPGATPSQGRVLGSEWDVNWTTMMMADEKFHVCWTESIAFMNSLQQVLCLQSTSKWASRTASWNQAEKSLRSHLTLLQGGYQPQSVTPASHSPILTISWNHRKWAHLRGEEHTLKEILPRFALPSHSQTPDQSVQSKRQLQTLSIQVSVRPLIQAQQSAWKHFSLLARFLNVMKQIYLRKHDGIHWWWTVLLSTAEPFTAALG